MNFTDLPKEIKSIIFQKNRERALEEKKELEDFWKEWGEDYEDDLDDLTAEKIIISADCWEDLDKADKRKIYQLHQKRLRIHRDIMCCGWSDELLE